MPGVGGMRTVTGAVTGTALVTAGNELFRQLGDKWKIERFPDLFLGGVLLAVMLLRPGGLLGDLDLLGRLRQRWRPAPRSATPPVRDRTLVAEDIVVDFGGFRALDEAAIRVRPGEVVGLIGPNGAGKTTLFNVVTGLVAETSGSVRLGELDLSTGTPFQIARSGLARTFQNLRVFKNLSVRENVELTSLVAWKHRGGGPSADELLESAGLTSVADRPAGTLDYGNQRRLELVRAAALAPEFLLLDEPTSGMSDAESLAMVDRVRATAAALGCGVLVIDHDLGFITLPMLDTDLVIAGIGLGLVIAPLTSATLRVVPAAQHGIASAAVVVARMIGMLIGVAALSAWGLYKFNQYLQERLAELPPADPNSPGGLIVAATARVGLASRDAYVMQFGEIFRITCIVCIVGAVLAVLISGRHEHADEPEPEDEAPKRVRVGSPADDNPTQAIETPTHKIPSQSADETARLEQPRGHHRPE